MECRDERKKNEGRKERRGRSGSIEERRKEPWKAATLGLAAEVLVLVGLALVPPVW